MLRRQRFVINHERVHRLYRSHRLQLRARRKRERYGEALTMDLNAATITAGVSLVGVIITACISIMNTKRTADNAKQLAAMNRETESELARIQQTISDATADRSARRGYEYDARKRLYEVCEPLLFQLHEDSEFATRRIRAMAKVVRNGEGSIQFSTDKYYLLSTVYFLFRPLVAYQLMRSRLGAIDVSLDDNINVHFQLCKLLYRSFTHGGSLARKKPSIEYDVYQSGRPNAVSSRQDIALGRLDKISQAMVKGDNASAGLRERSLTFGEFESQMADPTSALRTAFAEVLPMFEDFNPQTRPVLWRILISQVFAHDLIMRQGRQRLHQDHEAFLIAPPSFSAKQIDGFRWCPASCVPEEFSVTELFAPFVAAQAYFRDRIFKNAMLGRFIDTEAWEVGGLPDLAKIESRIKKVKDKESFGNPDIVRPLLSPQTVIE